MTAATVRGPAPSDEGPRSTSGAVVANRSSRPASSGTSTDRPPGGGARSATGTSPVREARNGASRRPTIFQVAVFHRAWSSKTVIGFRSYWAPVL